MNKVVDLFGITNTTSGDVGVEIEVEGTGLFAVHEGGWRTDHDGSLRNGFEYVMTQPKSLTTTYKSLDYLEKRFRDGGAIINEAVRAGMHAHINVQQLTENKLFGFITAYGILEDLLTKYCGVYREGNHFCLRMKDAEYLTYVIEQVAKKKHYHLFGDEVIRYSAMNLCALSKYGSIEFRAMRSTPDFNVYKTWVGVLLNIREMAKEFDSATEIVEHYYENGAESFCKLFLGDFFEEIANGIDLEEYTAEGAVRMSPIGKEVVWPSDATYIVGGLEFPANVEFPNEPEEDY